MSVVDGQQVLSYAKGAFTKGGSMKPVSMGEMVEVTPSVFLFLESLVQEEDEEGRRRTFINRAAEGRVARLQTVEAVEIPFGMDLDSLESCVISIRKMPSKLFIAEGYIILYDTENIYGKRVRAKGKPADSISEAIKEALKDLEKNARTRRIVKLSEL